MQTLTRRPPLPRPGIPSRTRQALSSARSGCRAERLRSCTATSGMPWPSTPGRPCRAAHRDDASTPGSRRLGRPCFPGPRDGLLRRIHEMPARHPPERCLHNALAGHHHVAPQNPLDALAALRAVLRPQAGVTDIEHLGHATRVLAMEVAMVQVMKIILCEDAAGSTTSPSPLAARGHGPAPVRPRRRPGQQRRHRPLRPGRR